MTPPRFIVTSIRWRCAYCRCVIEVEHAEASPMGHIRPNMIHMMGDIIKDGYRECLCVMCADKLWNAYSGEWRREQGAERCGQ